MDVGVPQFTGYPYSFFFMGKMMVDHDRPMSCRAGVGSAAGPMRPIKQNQLANALSFLFQHGSQIC